ncbi:MAG: hypothetical protein A2Y41_00525 [Spirochaetes bacterium GWB1_36_13]|nr:MAG: hypothetical protein A2Y41_00525 [Spirochaetes bacterium GWB1_36_13]
MALFDKYFDAVQTLDPIRLMGTVTKVEGSIIYTNGPIGKVGEVCKIMLQNPYNQSKEVFGEIIGFRDKSMIIMPYYDVEGIYPGCEVKTMGDTLTLQISESLRGRVIDGLGNPMDERSQVFSQNKASIFNSPPNPLTKPLIKEQIFTGIKAIDGLLSVGKGQRLGIFAGSGVGKSTLLGMIARYIQADINIIALIGERGKEVREFIENDLGEEGLKKSILVVATGDTSPLMKVRAAYSATAIAEFFREQGYSVNFMMDSVTRLAMAQKEIGLGLGEAPGIGGYTSSVFSTIQKLLERTGNSKNGSITAFYTVLVQGDDFNEPITDAVRGILDGHIMLKRHLADKGHYPAIDVLNSISRSMIGIVSPEHRQFAMTLKELFAVYQEQEDLINVGGYQRGSNPKIDIAIQLYPSIINFLKQDIHEFFTFDQILASLNHIINPEPVNQKRKRR